MRLITLLFLTLACTCVRAQVINTLPTIDDPRDTDRTGTYTRGFAAAFRLDTLRKYFAANIVEGIAVNPNVSIPDSLRGRFFKSTLDSIYYVDYFGGFVNLKGEAPNWNAIPNIPDSVVYSGELATAQLAANGYADLKEQRASRGSISQGANMAYKIGVDTFQQPNIWLVGDSKLNAVHTISKIQANYGAAYGFAGTGYMSISTKNNGRLGLIPRATSSTPVEYPGTVFAKYSLDGQAQELTGTGEVRIELNTNYTTYTDDLTSTYWDYAKISYLRHPSGGDISIIVDGVAIDTVNANGVEAKIVYGITGIADTSHTLTLKNISGTNYTLDGYFLRTNAKGIIVNCLSNSGYDAELFNTLLDFPNKEMISSYPPDAVVVRLGTNDSNRDFTPTAFSENVERIVDTLQNYGTSSDVLLVGIEGMSLGTIYTDAEYNAELKSSADARYWRFANLYDIVPNAATFQSRGFSTDAVHESREGSHLIGNFIFSAIQNNVGASSLPQDLQAVTDVGATTNNPITINANLNLQDANGNLRIGLQAGEDLTTGTFNIMRGYQSGLNTTTGGYNVFDGYQVAFRNTTGEKNVVIGSQSLFNNKTGSQNFALGAQAGQFATGSVPLFTANQSMYVGPMTEAAYDNPINENVFGFDAIGNGSNSFTFGNDNTDSTFLKGTVHFNAAPDLNSNYLGGLLDPVSNQQGATKGYVDAQTSAIASQWTTTGSDIYYNTGNVGIGTSTPTTNFHISEPTLNAQLRLDAAQFATFVISSDRSSTSNRDPSFRFETQGTERWRVGVDDSDSDAFVISPSVLSSTAAAIFIKKDNKYVGFGTDPTQQIDVAGSIRARGIGTGTPTTGLGTTSNGTFAQTDLFVNSTIQTDINQAQTDAEAYADANDANTVYDDTVIFDSLAVHRLAIDTLATSTDVAAAQSAAEAYADANNVWTTTGSDIYYNAGNVGIGTSTPTTNFHISEPTLNASLRLDAAQFATFIISSDLSSTSDRDPSFRFETQGTERWRVGVDDSDSDAFLISPSVLSSTAAAIFIKKDNKYVGFGTDPTQQIDVAGSIRARGIGTGTPTTGIGTTSNGTFAQTDLFVNSTIQTDINQAQTDAEAYADANDANTQLSESQVDAFANDNGYLTAEVDGSITNEIQTIDVATFTGTDLNISLSGDGEATKVIDLSSLKDGPTRVTRTSNLTRTSASVATDASLTTASLVAGLYKFKAVLVYRGSDVDTDLEYEVERTFALNDFSMSRSNDATSVRGLQGWPYVADVATTSSTATHIVIIEGTFYNSLGNAIKIDWGGTDAVGSITMIRGSYLETQKID
jgi:hypothetical protein